MSLQRETFDSHNLLDHNPELVLVPEGWFSMGSNLFQELERPVHRVWVDSFRMAATQVTVAEFLTFLQERARPALPYLADSHFNNPEHPVVAVSWFEATAYCEWLSEKTGSHYRLPTEAEWERAARAGLEGAIFPWGDEPPASRVGYEERWKNGPEPVRRSEPNGYGLFEMCENVHEWCADWFDANYYSTSPERNPQGPPGGARKSSRGGSWRHHVKISRCSSRSSIPPEFQYADYGFRVVSDHRK